MVSYNCWFILHVLLFSLINDACSNIIDDCWCLFITWLFDHLLDQILWHIWYCYLLINAACCYPYWITHQVLLYLLINAIDSYTCWLLLPFLLYLLVNGICYRIGFIHILLKSFNNSLKFTFHYIWNVIVMV